MGKLWLNGAAKFLTSLTNVRFFTFFKSISTLLYNSSVYFNQRPSLVVLMLIQDLFQVPANPERNGEKKYRKKYRTFFDNCYWKFILKYVLLFFYLFLFTLVVSPTNLFSNVWLSSWWKNGQFQRNFRVKVEALKKIKLKLLKFKTFNFDLKFLWNWSFFHYQKITR